MTVATEMGDIELVVPRDPAGTFDPATVPKHPSDSAACPGT